MKQPLIEAMPFEILETGIGEIEHKTCDVLELTRTLWNVEQGKPHV